VEANHTINVFIKEDCIVDASKDTHSYEGSFIASFIRSLLVRQNKSFSFETVMSHPSKIKELKNIVKNGYKLYLYFVCIDSPEVNKTRVVDRLKKGGHACPLTRLSIDIIELLHQILPICYRAYLFDNSGKKT
jgi:predicted ABC-type ATPase